MCCIRIVRLRRFEPEPDGMIDGIGVGVGIGVFNNEREFSGFWV